MCTIRRSTTVVRQSVTYLAIMVITPKPNYLLRRLISNAVADRIQRFSDLKNIRLAMCPAQITPKSSPLGTRYNQDFSTVCRLAKNWKVVRVVRTKFGRKAGTVVVVIMSITGIVCKTSSFGVFVIPLYLSC